MKFDKSLQNYPSNVGRCSFSFVLYETLYFYEKLKMCMRIIKQTGSVTVSAEERFIDAYIYLSCDLDFRGYTSFKLNKDSE